MSWIAKVSDWKISSSVELNNTTKHSVKPLEVAREIPSVSMSNVPATEYDKN